MPTRREMIATAAAGALIPALPRMATAEMMLGAAKLTTLSDGHLTLPASMVFETMPQDALAPIVAEFGLGAETLTPECNLALLQHEDHNILFDVGSGANFMPSAGEIVDSLDAMGLAPEDITHVVFTHAHPDHIWGLLDDFDDPLFYEATHMMGRAEWDYWWNPATVDQIGEARASFAVGAKRRMEAIEDSVVLFDDGEEILPGVAALATPGHTPGHMAFEIRQGSQAALVVGDAIGNHHVAFRKPEWESGADQDAALAVKTRAMLFDRLVHEDLALIGFHLPGGGMGRAEKAAEGYTFISGDL